MLRVHTCVYGTVLRVALKYSLAHVCYTGKEIYDHSG